MDMIKWRVGKTDSQTFTKTYSVPRRKTDTESIKSASTDTLTISGEKPTSVPDEQFAAGLKKRMMNEVKEGASEYKVQDLRRQVALGEYDIGVTEMIRKMMFEGDM